MTTLKIRDRMRATDKSSNSLFPMLSNSGCSVAEFKQATIVPQYSTRLSTKCCQIASTAAL